MKSLFGAALAVGLALASTVSMAQEGRTRIAGTIESVDGQALVIAGDDGSKPTLTLDAGASVIGVAASDLADVLSGSYVGIAATRAGDGSFSARSVHIFPEGMRGVAEGQSPMPGGDDLTMTNGTVAKVEGADAKSITVSFSGSEATIAVPAGTPVVELQAGDSALLVPGAHVVAFARDVDDAYTAPFILVGKDGVVPPM